MRQLRDIKPNDKLTLGDLDLSVEVIHKILKAGDAVAKDCTKLDPIILASTNRWGRSVRVLRELLIPQKWTYDRYGQLERTIHPSREFCIVVSTGDENTGNPLASPHTNNPRGVQSIAAINRNAEQLALFPLEAVGGQTPPDEEQMMTWFLLVRGTDRGLFAELSLPERTTEGGTITSWRYRIHIPPILFEDGQEPPAEDAGFHVDVQPR